MKTKFILSSILMTTLLLASCVQASSNCSSNASAVPCVDMSGVDTMGVCTTEYDPVCGCDDKTYSNSCEATQAGVQAWVEGECCP